MLLLCLCSTPFRTEDSDSEDAIAVFFKMNKVFHVRKYKKNNTKYDNCKMLVYVKNVNKISKESAVKNSSCWVTVISECEYRLQLLVSVNIDYSYQWVWI